MITENFIVAEHTIFKNKMLNWASRFNIFCFLDSNKYNNDSTSFDCLLAAGCARSISLKAGEAFKTLKNFYENKPSWLFGHLGYGLKNEVEVLLSSHKDFIDFEDGFFFEPEILLKLKNCELTIIGSENNALAIFNAINETQENILSDTSSKVIIQPFISRDEYINIIKVLQHHIKKGDCYEINFCQQFFSKEAIIDPLNIYQQLVKISPNPFSAFYKLNDKYCLCASPERYLKKTGQGLISQPIKGTSKRNISDKAKDEMNKDHLFNSSKDRSENVMIVDLVRNDLSRICKEGSVVVKELFAVHSFPQLHQMISTVNGEMKEDLHWTDALKATFPMGSMTGAPKKRVMELIDKYEPAARGLFSGSIGYITPEADFDFNVVIRSIFYDAEQQHLSFSAGGGVTFNSIPEHEYNESLLKAEVIRSLLEK